MVVIATSHGINVLQWWGQICDARGTSGVFNMGYLQIAADVGLNS